MLAMKKIIYKISFCLVFLSVVAMGQEITLDKIHSGYYRTQSINGINSMNDGEHYYPRDVLEVNSISGNSKTEPRYHPTQKPLALMEFLIKTYTNEWEIVLDATMGSGSTGVAAINTGRRFIGFETEKNFYEIAERRISKAVAEKDQSLF